MKKVIFILLALVVIPTPSIAKKFLGAPVIPEGKVTEKMDDRLELKTPLSHDEVLSYYKKALKGYENIKFRDWKNDTYIEDDGNMQWHSITISKTDTDGARVVIVKDSWTWIIGTLVLRYIGVFMVLMVLFLAMTFSGKIISSVVAKLEAKKAT
ncbi:MAG: hypothetical protein U5R49_11105 [Deltaproteobacteria bacterium]|nr:hypothetical protein [Deltaproteobacteria bacterium]